MSTEDAKELKEEIRKLCRSALDAEGSINTVFSHLITDLGKLTGNDFWAED